MTEPSDPLLQRLQRALPEMTDWKLIASGGSADVWSAEEKVLNRKVAVKLLRNRMDQATRSAFQREAQISGALTGHPHIVSIHQASVTADGHPLLVMEYCPGGTLQDRLDVEGRLSVSEAIEIVSCLSSALTFAHQQGTLHLDVKPSNVLIDRSGTFKLADFGIARFQAQTSSSSGRQYTLEYAAPEILEDSAPLGPHTDTWMLAGTFAALILGRSPFAASTGAATAYKIISGAPDPLEGDDVTMAVQAAVKAALQVDTEARTGTPAELLKALTASPVGRPGSRTTIQVAGPPPRPGQAIAGAVDLEDESPTAAPPVPTPTQFANELPSAVLSPPSQRIRRRRGRVAGLAIAALGVAGSVALLPTFIGDEPRSDVPATGTTVPTPESHLPSEGPDEAESTSLDSAIAGGGTSPAVEEANDPGPAAPNLSSPGRPADQEEQPSVGSSATQTTAPSSKSTQSTATTASSSGGKASPSASAPAPTTSTPGTTARSTAAATTAPKITSPKVSSPGKECEAGWNVHLTATDKAFAVNDLKEDGAICRVEYYFTPGDVSTASAAGDGAGWTTRRVGSQLPEDIWWRVCGSACSQLRHDQTNGAGSPLLTDATRACEIGWDTSIVAFSTHDLKTSDGIACGAQLIVGGRVSAAIGPVDVDGWKPAVPAEALGDLITWRLCLFRGTQVVDGSCLDYRDDRTTA